MLKWRSNIEAGEPVLVAVSGGADSVYLVHHLAETIPQNPLHIAHVNHGTRGTESDGDEEFVRSLATRLDLPFYALRIDTSAVETGGSPTSEGNLRTMRLGVLKATARAIGSRIIALGHHADDLAETFLLNALRGAGVAGLSGMESWRAIPGDQVLLRPLLRFTRREIEAQLQEMEQTWRTDESNASGAYKRNRLRNEVMPLLCDIDIAAVESLAESARIAGEIRTYLDAQAARMAERHTVAAAGDTVLISTGGLRAEGLPRALVPHLLTQFMNRLDKVSHPQSDLPKTVNRATIRTIADYFEDGITEEREFELSANIRMYVYTTFGLVTAKASPVEAALEVRDAWPWLLALDLKDRFGKESFPTLGMLVETFENGDPAPGVGATPVVPSLNSAFIDKSELVGEAILRTLEPRERIALTDGHSKSAADAVKEAGVPGFLRPHVMALCDDAGPIWIPGIRRAARALITDTTRSYIHLSRDAP